MLPSTSATNFLLLLAFFYTYPANSDNQTEEIPPYVKQCREDDPKLIDCIIKGIDHVRPYLSKGIPEIELPPVEPFRIDSLSLALTGGPNGYKITLREIDVYGLSNFAVTKIKFRTSESAPFEVKIRIPKLSLDAKYTSSGVLIVIPASGNGTFHAEMGDISGAGVGTMSSIHKGGKEYFRLDELDIDLDIKDVKMQVRKIFNNNRILIEATNLFLRENGQEVVKVMMPQLKGKIVNIFKRIINQLLSHVPSNMFYIRNNRTIVASTTLASNVN